MKLKINQIFDFDKWSLQSLKNIPWEYDFITASEDWKTHNEYTHNWEFLVFAMWASWSLGRTHYVNWKFISSDLCFIISPKDKYKDKINLKFYHTYFNVIKEDIVKHTATWTSKIAINRKNFWNYELFLPDLEFQNSFFEKFIEIKNSNDKLLDITNQNQNYIKLLKQSILQEAIEWKLTKSWREKNKDIEPASVLLEKIKAEKEELVKQKKFKKQKELDPISENEIPFDIPESWEWSKLGNIIKESWNLNIHSQLDENELINYVDIASIDSKKYEIWEIIPQKVSKLSSRARRVLKKWYIMYSLVRPYLNNLAIIKNEKDNYIGSTWFNVFKPIIININYVFNFLLSDYVKNYYLELMKWFNSPWITNDNFINTLFPLPPLEEQKEIVKRVDEMMKLCDELEKQTLETKENSENLMKAVLGEVFSK